MIVHVVLFRLRPTAPESDLHAAAAAFRRAVDVIPSIRRARFGRRVLAGRPYDRMMQVDYGFAAILEFDDAAGLHVYLTHPAHEPLAAAFFSIFEDALMYDFALEDGATAVPDFVVEPAGQS